MIQYVASEPPAMAKMSAVIRAGSETVPTSKSVPAKQAKSMLDIFCSLGLVITAAITKTFSKITAGQLIILAISTVHVTRLFIVKKSLSWDL